MIFRQHPILKANASVPVFRTEEVPGSDVLIVSFSGLFGAFVRFEFSNTTERLSYNRIQVRDPYRLFFLLGVDENGFDHLRERLRVEIDRFQAKKVIFIGASAGGYAALLFGHLLGADYIHAFSPRAHLQLLRMVWEGDYKSVLNRFPTVWTLHWKLPAHHRRFLNLKPLLNESRGKPIRTHLHACAHCIDAVRIRYLEDCPNTKLFLYPGAEHNVSKLLVRSNCLHTMLQERNLDTPEQVYREFYGEIEAVQRRRRAPIKGTSARP